MKMVAAHLFAVSLPTMPDCVIARIAVSFIMYHGKMLDSLMKCSSGKNYAVYLTCFKLS